MPNDYEIVHQARKAQRQTQQGQDTKQPKELLPSDKKTLTPYYLLNHQNHFDPNVMTDEKFINHGNLTGPSGADKQDET